MTAALLLAVTVPLFGLLRPDVWTSALLFSLAASVAGARTLIANVVGLDVAPERRLAVMAIRAFAVQVGYFVGAGAAGAALTIGGYPALGTVLGMFFFAASITLSNWTLPGRRQATASGRVGAPCPSCA